MRQITERLRDPRGIRRGGAPGAGPRNFAVNGGRQRGFVRPVNFSFSAFIVFCLTCFVIGLCSLFQAERNDANDLPPAKRRLSSAVVKVKRPLEFPVLVFSCVKFVYLE